VLRYPAFTVYTYVQIIKTCLYMSALYLLHILYNVLSIKVSDNKVYMIHVHLYRSGPIWLDILYTKMTGHFLSVCLSGWLSLLPGVSNDMIFTALVV
jgi:hypothetical protein